MSNINSQGYEPKSITINDFEQKYSKVLDEIAELVETHPEMPEHLQTDELLGALTTMKIELRSSLTNRVPEIVELQQKVQAKDNKITDLQNTVHKYYLQVGEYRDPKQQTTANLEPPKKTFAEIKKMIEES